MDVLIVFFLLGDFWIETTQQDFADGVFEHTIYASHRGGGAIEYVPRFDLNNNGYIDLWTADASGPDVKIYWGDSTGYSPSLYTLFPTTGAANCDAADLNSDGYPDFVVAHRLTPKVTIYWGTVIGPNPGFYFDIPTIHQESQAVFASDLNKDGHIDLIISLEIASGNASILWGSQIGYNISNRTDLPISFGIHNIEIADLNHDNFLDIVFVQYQNMNNPIYWGSSAGYLPSNYTLLPGPGSHGASVADLNNDHYLDIIFNAWNGSRSYIYWGDSNGYSPSNMQILNPGSCYGGSCVQDLNNDNYLDILYHRTGAPQLIYWGCSTGFSDFDTMRLVIPIGSTGGIICDLNADSVLDIFFNCLGGESYVTWGPSWNTWFPFPVNNDHHAMFREIGNTYNRQYYDEYLSSVAIPPGHLFNWGTVTWNDSLPLGASIDIMIRSGNAPYIDTSWSDWLLVSNGDSIPDTLNSRYIQYQAILRYANPAFFPVLYDIQIEYSIIIGITENDKRSQNILNISPSIVSDHSVISYWIRENSRVKLAIYNITGQCVTTLVNTHQSAGQHTIKWNNHDDYGKRLASGRYYVSLVTDEGVNASQFIQIR